MHALMSPANLRRWGALSGLVIVCLTGTLACESGDSAAPASRASNAPSADAAPPAPSPTKSPAEVAGQQATEAYVGMWQAMARAGETSNWQAPELAQYATGNALTTITRSLYADHFNHVVSRGRPKNNPTVSAVDPPNNPSTVRINDCGDSTNWLQYKEGTNEPVDNSPGGRRSIVAEVKKQADGSWKVDRFAVEGLGSC